MTDLSIVEERESVCECMFVLAVIVFWMDVLCGVLLLLLLVTCGETENIPRLTGNSLGSLSHFEHLFITSRNQNSSHTTSTLTTTSETSLTT
ncbi:hypothetical protein E2C01_001380 [Portunus trituberculatus]|uniref:Uncharacterized protein n=1 Tax=Portunus trituberculatus TaxID=210409 RepID=A0A5B7CHU9_PORTR|nr:hypothetical protein [Portunus trituberculatus]